MTSEATVMTYSALAGDAVLLAAEADDDLADRPVADVDDARPADREGVDAERVAVVEVVVEEGADARLWAAPMAWMSPVRWRLKSSIGMIWL